MTQSNISGPGIGLQLPQQLYPANLFNGEVNVSTNTISLAPGETLPIPAGQWIISLGKYCSLQYLDPVTTAWTLLRDNDNNSSGQAVQSDGFNIRVANLTGCVVGAYIAGTTGGWVAGTTTITPSTGNSTWLPIIGGAINTANSITAVGANYGIAPLVYIDAPPVPGVQATAIANISGGTLTSLTWLNVGAGYTIAPNIVLLPSPNDPNITASTGITNATVLCSLTGAGSITAAICTNSGAPVASTMSLTVAGAGTGCTATALFLQTFSSATFTVGVGYGASAGMTSIPGSGSNIGNNGVYANPQISLANFVPRPMQVGLATSGGSVTSVTQIVDGGLFLSTPSVTVLTNGVVTTVTTVTVTLGSANDTIRLQQI